METDTKLLDGSRISISTISSSLSSLTKDNDCENTSKFDDLQDFVDYVLIECSNCVKKESCIKEIENSKLYDCYKDNPKDRPEDCNKIVNVGCKEIKTVPLTARFFKKLGRDGDKKRFLVPHILCLFQTKGLLTKRGGVYYLLNTHIRLTWNNIKLLREKHIKKLEKKVFDEIQYIFNSIKYKYDDLTLIKCLFWYLRKAVVDSILSDIINHYKNKYNNDTNIIAMSVGSTKLSSDYDISLDTSYEIGASIITKFTKLIERVFKDDSESIFDTNVYGVSFTKRRGDDHFKKSHECDSNNIYYVAADTKIEISQMIWCYIKLLLKLSFVLKQDDKVYEKLYSYLDNSEIQNNELFNQAVIFVNKYKSNIENYGEIVSKYDDYIKKNKITIRDENYLISNFISFVNYNGSETYLTNGAFMDVVINQQLCSTGDKIKILRPYMYFTSFIENISDLLIHYHKSKYTERCKNSLKELNELLKDKGLSDWSSVYSDTLDLLKWLKVTQKKCDDDVYKCQVFDVMYTCVYIIEKVSNVYYKYVENEYSNLKVDVDMFNSIEFIEINEDVDESISPTKVK